MLKLRGLQLHNDVFLSLASLMVRLPRLVIPNQPLHIMHRGNNRQDILNSEDDMIRIKEDIEHGLEKSGCSFCGGTLK